jgi:hypothetical protein
VEVSALVNVMALVGGLFLLRRRRLEEGCGEEESGGGASWGDLHHGERTIRANEASCRSPLSFFKTAIDVSGWSEGESFLKEVERVDGRKRIP